MRTRALALLAFAVLGAGGCAGFVRRPDAPPDLPVLSELRGKVVLVDFWATWCDPCRESMPMFEGLFKKYGSRGLSVVGVSEDSEPASARRAAAERGVTYRLAFDPRGRSLAASGARSLPATLLIGADGRVRARWSGFPPGRGAEIEAAIGKLLAESPVQ
ncbi:MAG: TlpA family protein disulfide reductase [Elusimicrobiota bacterium]